MRPDSRRFMVLLALFAAYCGGIALRLALTSPLNFWWFVGQVYAFVTAAVIGYIWRGDRERRHRKRESRRRGGC